MTESGESTNIIYNIWNGLSFSGTKDENDKIQSDDSAPSTFRYSRQPSMVIKSATLNEAAEKEDEATFARLLHENPEGVNEKGPILGESLIHRLCLRGGESRNNMVKLLVKTFPHTITQICTESELYGATALHISIVKENISLVEWLLEEKENEPYREQLLKATATGKFFKKGRPCYYGETPLAFACCTNQWDMVEILLKYGACMNAMSSDGNNILHLLVIHSLPEMYTKFKARWIEETEKRKAEEDEEQDDGENSDSDNSKIVPLWKRLNKDGFTPLTLAAKLGLYDMFSFLLDERKITQWSFGPVSCVLYPLDQVDLDFHEDDNEKGTSALEIIVQNALVKLIMHPRMVDLVDKKWERFAKRIFFRRFFVGLLYFSIFLITTILDQARTETFEGEDENAVITAVEPPGMLWQILCTLGRLFVLAGAIYKGRSESQELFKLGFRKYFQTTGSGLLENCLSCLFCLTIVLVNIARMLDSDIETALLAMAAIFGWGYMLFFVMAFRMTGPFVVMIYQMLFNDVLRFFIIYAVFLIGFSQAFFILFDYNGFTGFVISLKLSFLGLLGDFDLDTYVEAQFSFLSVMLLMIYIIVVTILLLNLLVAMMGDTYGKIIDDATEVWQLERARIVFAIENEMETEERNLESNKYWTNVKGKRYLQVQEVNEKLYEIKEEEKSNDDDTNKSCDEEMTQFEI